MKMKSVMAGLYTAPPAHLPRMIEISGTMPRGFVRPLVERIIPSVLAGRRRGLEEVDEFVAEHVDQTCDHLLETSQSVRAAVESGRTAVVGLTYSLSEGTARPGRVHGDLAV